MKISAFTKLSGFACIALSILTISLVFLMNLSIDKERFYVQQQLEFRQLGHDLGQASNFLTKEARRYTIFGDKRHYDAYWKEVNETRTRDKVVERLRELNATSAELALIETAKANSDELIAIEDKAMRAVAQGDLGHAQTLMFDENYDRNKKNIMTPIKDFQHIMNVRAEFEANKAQRQANILLWVTNAVILIYIFLVLFILYFVFLRKVSQPLSNITQAIDQIASGGKGIVIPYTNTQNEIGQLANAAEMFKGTLEENQKLTVDLEKNKDNLEQEVKIQTADLLELNTELEEFSYRVSHDLRSPLVSSVSLLTIGQKAIEANNIDKAIKSLGLAQSGLKKLEALTEDILALARSKKLEEDSIEIDIPTLVDDMLESFSHMEGFDAINFQKTFDFDETIITKKSRLIMIVENLISNAIKYKDPEEENPFIKISTRSTGGKVVLEVEDNGLGIPKEQQKNLFTMFQRFHPKVSFGSGLGLYLMKKSADILQANIMFEDTQNGSIFRLSMPLLKGVEK